jgi:signal transduction histidine kinase
MTEPTPRSRILVVDDSPVAVAAIRSALGDEVDIEVEHDGESALATLERGSFDLVITDWLMPRLDGHALCRAIRARPALAGLYIIFLTVQDKKEHVVEGLLAGADDYVPKPFHAEELRARVRVGLRMVNAQRERAAAEAEREQLHREHIERLEELGRMKDEFVALVSHELRTPLTSILGYLEMVLEDADRLSDEQRDFLGVLERNALRLLQMVSDLLFVAQVESGKLRLELGDVELGPVVSETIEAQRPVAEAKRVRLRLDVEPVPPLRGDRARLAQLVDNLLANAIKFTPPEGSVEVRLHGLDDVTVIEVSDTGIGIPRDEQERVFQRFFRTSNVTEKEIPGTGLGLSIVKAIAESHGGSVVVSSSPGRGTTFRVELPVDRAAQAA